MIEPGAGERARELAPAWADEWYKTQPNLYDYLEGKLAGALAAVRLETIEEIAVFTETHYCIIKADEPGGYKTETREKHPNEPFARAIRALGERAVEGK